MRKNRLILYAIWIISLIGISFFGGSISYGFFFVVTLTPVVSLLYLICVYFFFHMYQKINSRWLVVNQVTPFYFTLANDYLFVFSGIRVKFYSSFSTISGLSEDIEYELLAKSRINKETNLVCKYRGEYEVGIKTVVIEDYLRLFTFSYHNREPLKVMVRPQIVKLDALNSVEMQSFVKDSGGQGSEPDVLVRAYLPGDDIRQVHWPLSARQGELMVRKKIGEEQQGVSVLMSTKRTSKDEMTYLPVENKMLEIAIALSWYFCKKSIPVSHFHLQNGIKNYSFSGENQFDGYYDFVSSVIFQDDKQDSLLFKEVANHPLLTESKICFMILSSYEKETNHIIEALARNNVQIVLYFVGYEVPRELLALNNSNLSVIKVEPQEDVSNVL